MGEEKDERFDCGDGHGQERISRKETVVGLDDARYVLAWGTMESGYYLDVCTQRKVCHPGESHQPGCQSHEVGMWGESAVLQIGVQLEITT